MKPLIRVTGVLWIILFFTGQVRSQSLTNEYRFALGLRAGETSGITFKFKTKNNSNIEFIAGLWTNWFNITALYEKNAPAFNVDGMYWYYGGGGHVSVLTDVRKDNGRYYNRGEDFALGIDGIVGLEYKIPPIPFAVSFDLKPLVEVYRDGGVYVGIDPGIGIKFTF